MDILIGTFTMRPYVFAFFAAFLLACVPHVGWRRTLAFTGVGYLIAFTSEWLSINTGFPYGWYYYIETTKLQELWVAGLALECGYPGDPPHPAFAVGPDPGGVPADIS